MPNWINNPHADYVLAAYAIACMALVGTLLSSWCSYRKQSKKWQNLKVTRDDP
jgi:heme exporter protein CcmD